MSLTLVALILAIIGVVFAVINNEVRSSTFWFWTALLTAVILGGLRI